MNKKRMEPKKITALYERLSRDNEQIGGSNSIVNPNAMLKSHAAHAILLDIPVKSDLKTVKHTQVHQQAAWNGKETNSSNIPIQIC